jgi:hypothetical protein
MGAYTLLFIALVLLPNGGVTQQPTSGMKYPTQAACEAARADLAAIPQEDWRRTRMVFAVVCVPAL